MVHIFNGSIQKYIEMFQKKHTLNDKGVFEVDVHEWMGKFTIDILGLAAFGTDFNCLSDMPAPIASAYETLRTGLSNMGGPSYLFFFHSFPFFHYLFLCSLFPYFSHSLSS